MEEKPSPDPSDYAEPPDDIPVPESHLLLAEERLADYRRDPSRARSAYDLLDELARARGVKVGSDEIDDQTLRL